MNFIDRLERKIGKIAIPNLMIYLIGIYALGLVLNYINPDFYIMNLSLKMYEIIHGLQLWRLITFLCAPPSDNIIIFLFLSFIYYSIGRTLEQMWGTFRFNLYIFLGVFGVVLSALIIYLVFGEVYLLTADQLYLSMLLGIAATLPDLSFLLYFVIPIKAKWLGIFYGAYIIYEIISCGIRGDWPSVIAIVLSLLNFIVFFVFLRKHSFIKRKPKIRFTFGGAGGGQTHSAKTADSGLYGRKGVPRHRCSVCGITDLDAPDMEFRFCSKCGSNREYCSEHLFTHTHVQ